MTKISIVYLMSSALEHNVHAVLGAGGADDGSAHGSSDLNGRSADRSRCL